MASIQDSPVSKLSAAVDLSADDLLLASKSHGDGKFTSNGITFDRAVSSIINYSTTTLSAYFQQHISAFAGATTMTEWQYVPNDQG